MRLDDVLFSQGFGTRRLCAGLIEQGYVAVAGQPCTDPAAEVDALDAAFAFSVQGERWPYRARAYLMLHKPTGHECSHRPGAWPSVYTLLPPPLRQRPAPGKVAGVQAVGNQGRGPDLFTDADAVAGDEFGDPAFRDAVVPSHGRLRTALDTTAVTISQALDRPGWVSRHHGPHSSISTIQRGGIGVARGSL